MAEDTKVAFNPNYGLLDLVGHKLAVPGNTLLADVQKAFHEHTFKYMAIHENGRITGICSRERVGDLLGSQFGFSIYAKKLIREYAIPQPEILIINTPIAMALERVFSRPQEHFYHDVALVDAKYQLVGLIPVDNLVRFQNALLLDQLNVLSANEKSLLRQKGELADLAERLEVANSELQSARDVAVEGTKLKSQFLANMSHEIRTPMNGIIGMISLLTDSDVDDEQKHYCQTIQKSAEALLSLINDILDFSKIEAGRLDVSNEETPIRDLAEECLSLLAESAFTKQLELVLDIDPAVPEWIEVDPLRYRQILNNLIGNAIKFTDQGEIIVRIRVQGDAEQGYFLHTEVQDSGIGIREEHLKKLFEPFTQGDGSTSRKYGGTGLGLAISNRLAILMEGKLGCESEPDSGSTFWLTLPLSITKAPESVVQLRPLPKGLRVLVIDDHPIVAETLCRQITSFGPYATSVSDTVTAMTSLKDAIAANDPFHYLFVDLALPENSALKLFQEVEEEAVFLNTAVVFLSPAGTALDFNQSDVGKKSKILLKPVGPNGLEEVLHRAKPEMIENQKLEDASEHAVEQKSLQILLAEDNGTNREVAIRILERLGHTVHLAEDGMQALNVLRSETIDCVLMDCQMPVMDGYETTRAIREGFHGVTQKSIPIIAMTAHAMQGDRQRCLQAGMDDYISKPVTVERLAELLHRVGQKSGSIDS